MKCTLILESSDGICLELALQENLNLKIDTNNIENGVVYCDKSYKAYIKFDKKIEQLEFYVNDSLRKCYLKDDTIIFNDGNYLENKIFLEYFGYIMISINVKVGGEEYIFNSKYIDVAIKDHIFSESIRKMISYIANNCDKFLYSNTINSRDLANIKKSNHSNLETQISILKEIIFEYETNYKQFKTNKKFILRNNKKIDDFEKIQSIHPSTLQYILTNTKELVRTNSHTGIRYNKQNLVPKKTLITNKNYCYDIYENKILLGFLKSIYYQLDDKIKELKQMIIIKNNTSINSPYISSTKKIKEILFTNLLKHQMELENFKTKIQQLYVVYKNTLQCSEIIINDTPKPSKIFTTIIHYRKIYNVILRWFEYGNYDFEKENMILSFIHNSQIYEYFILLKLNNYYINNHFELESVRRNKYKMHPNAFYRNTEYENEFNFTKYNSKVTIYYQPVIYNKKINDNNIGLFRNYNINFYGIKSNNAYYVPDFIIKEIKNGVTNYLIIDSKFSDARTIQQRYLNEIIFKYIFSISTVNIDDKIKGIYIINGKDQIEKTNFFNIYNSSYNERNDSISPAFKILTLDPNIDEYEHMKDLAKMFN